MNTAKFSDGSTVRYDSYQDHGDQRLFFRGAIGLVRASLITEIENMNYDNNSNNETIGGGG